MLMPQVLASSYFCELQNQKSHAVDMEYSNQKDNEFKNVAEEEEKLRINSKKRGSKDGRSRETFVKRAKKISDLKVKEKLMDAFAFSEDCSDEGIDKDEITIRKGTVMDEFMGNASSDRRVSRRIKKGHSSGSSPLHASSEETQAVNHVYVKEEGRVMSLRSRKSMYTQDRDELLNERRNSDSPIGRTRESEYKKVDKRDALKGVVSTNKSMYGNDIQNEAESEKEVIKSGENIKSDEDDELSPCKSDTGGIDSKVIGMKTRRKSKLEEEFIEKDVQPRRMHHGHLISMFQREDNEEIDLMKYIRTRADCALKIEALKRAAKIAAYSTPGNKISSSMNRKTKSMKIKNTEFGMSGTTSKSDLEDDKLLIVDSLNSMRSSMEIDTDTKGEDDMSFQKSEEQQSVSLEIPLYDCTLEEVCELRYHNANGYRHYVDHQLIESERNPHFIILCRFLNLLKDSLQFEWTFQEILDAIHDEEETLFFRQLVHKLSSYLRKESAQYHIGHSLHRYFGRMVDKRMHLDVEFLFPLQLNPYTDPNRPWKYVKHYLKLRTLRLIVNRILSESSVVQQFVEQLEEGTLGELKDGTLCHDPIGQYAYWWIPQNGESWEFRLYREDEVRGEFTLLAKTEEGLMKYIRDINGRDCKVRQWLKDKCLIVNEAKKEHSRKLKEERRKRFAYKEEQKIETEVESHAIIGNKTQFNVYENEYATHKVFKRNYRFGERGTRLEARNSRKESAGTTQIVDDPPVLLYDAYDDSYDTISVDGVKPQILKPQSFPDVEWNVLLDTPDNMDIATLLNDFELTQLNQMGVLSEKTEILEKQNDEQLENSKDADVSTDEADTKKWMNSLTSLSPSDVDIVLKRLLSTDSLMHIAIANFVKANERQNKRKPENEEAAPDSVQPPATPVAYDRTMLNNLIKALNIYKRYIESVELQTKCLNGNCGSIDAKVQCTQSVHSDGMLIPQFDVIQSFLAATSYN